MNFSFRPFFLCGLVGQVAESELALGFPRPQTGARIPISWKRGFRGPKTPISLVLEKGVFCQKIPFFLQGNT